METRTPVTYMNNSIRINTGSSSSSSRRAGRHGRVVTCSRGGVQIKLGSSPNIALQQPHHQNDHPPHQLQQQQQQQDAEITQEQAIPDADAMRQRSSSPLRHVQPSAPGQQTLLRSWRSDSSVCTSMSVGQPTDGEDSEHTEPVEAVRPPPFNPDCSVSRHAESRPSGNVERTAAEKSTIESSSAGSITSTPGDDQNALPPPSYDEIYGGQKGHQYQDYDHHQKPQQQEQQPQRENLFQTSSVTGTTTDETAVCSSCLPCIVKFGHYTDPGTHPQPGRFTHPTRISVRVDQTDQPDGPAVMVTDPSTATVHVFTSKGDCLSVLRVPRVNGGCLIAQNSPPSPLLLLAVGTSVAVYEMDGRLVKEMPLSGRQQDAAVLTAVPYGERGFVAVRSHSLSICRGGITRPAVVRTLAGRYRADRGTTPFVNVVDVAVDSPRGCLVVLDVADPSAPGHRTAAYVMTEDGAVLQSIRPARDPRCGAMLQPFGVAVDRGGNVLVSDGGRVLQFSGDDGRYLATLIGEDSPTEHGRRDDIWVRGIAVASRGAEQLVFAVLTSVGFAQIRAFSLQS